jgi:AcrR family transcriptional regulator
MTKSADAPTAGAGRDRALAAAWKLFASQGYAEVSMQMIASAAGVNKATLYHHFGDKERLFVAVLSAEFALLREAISASIAVERPFREQLIAVAEALFQRSRSDSIRLTMTMHQHVSHLRRTKLHENAPPPWFELRGLFEREIVAGAVKPMDVDFAVTTLFGMVIFQAQRARFAGLAISDDQLAADLVDVFLTGIATPVP